MSTGKILIFSAPSGSGKSTIINHLIGLGLPLEFSVSATTRQPRGQETDGVEYYFLSVDEFRRRIEAGEFVEYEQVYQGCYYGTLRSEIDRIWAAEKHIVFDVDVVGGVNLKKLFGSTACSIFIQPPSVDELRRRLELRATDSPEKIAQRIAKAQMELSYAPQFDHIIVNDDLNQAFSEAETIVRKFLGE